MQNHKIHSFIKFFWNYMLVTVLISLINIFQIHFGDHLQSYALKRVQTRPSLSFEDLVMEINSIVFVYVCCFKFLKQTFLSSSIILLFPYSFVLCFLFLHLLSFLIHFDQHFIWWIWANFSKKKTKVLIHESRRRKNNQDKMKLRKRD